VKISLRKLADPEKAKHLSRFFKTGKGEYGEGDKFLGITVPVMRAYARQYADAPREALESLLDSAYHEERLLALTILTAQFERGSEEERKSIFDFYLARTDAINNWDLVDLSAYKIVGAYLLDRPRKILYRLAKSKNLWERRIAIISTFTFIRSGECEDTLKFAEMFLSDRHDLTHKATGWMLREVGKRCGEKKLKQFLDKNAARMPRTALRYAIERFSEAERKRYLAIKRTS